MIKILFHIDDLSAGGAEKVLCNLVNNMDQSKFDITVHTVNHYDSKKYLKEGIKYKSIINSKSSIGKKISTLWYRLCTQFKLTYPLYIKDDYDIEVAYLECGATKVMAASTNKKAKKVAWVHCDLSLKEGMQDSVNETKKYYDQFDNIVCVSEDVKTGFTKLYGQYSNITVLHNVIDEDEIFSKANVHEDIPINHNVKNLLAVGRLSKQKNFSYLINECFILQKLGIKFNLNILGEGPEREELERQIANLNLGNIIHLRGFVKNPYVWMKNSDVIVCSSLYEGISTVVQEALLLGKIVVTTPCTGMKDLLGDSEYGIITTGLEEGLCDSLLNLLSDTRLEEKYLKAAKLRARSLRKQNIVNETENMFLALMKSKKD